MEFVHWLFAVGAKFNDNSLCTILCCNLNITYKVSLLRTVYTSGLIPFELI